MAPYGSTRGCGRAVVPEFGGVVRNGSKAPFWQSIGHFRSCPINRHAQGLSACLKRANNGSPAASLWKSCFAETIDIHLSLPLTGMGYPFRYSEMGLNLKELGHRLPSFCISP
jgi:hypothetical protein